MSLNPGYHEQQLMAGARERQTARLSERERWAEIIVGGLYLLAALALLVAVPPEMQTVSVIPAALCVIALIVATTTEFDTGSGITVPTQLAFVPLLFTLPPAMVPVAVPAAWALAKLPSVLRGELRAVRLLAVFANSWFVIGPVLVLAAVDYASPHGHPHCCSRARCLPSSPATSPRLRCARH